MKVKNLKLKIKNEKFGQLVSDNLVDKTIKALTDNGFKVYMAEDSQTAKKQLLELIPPQSEVMDMTSTTLQSLGITEVIKNSGQYISVRKKLEGIDNQKEKRQLANVPDFAIGSVQAITSKGQVLIASNTGSQIPAYSYAASNVIWLVGSQKIVKNLDEGFKRIYKYCLPLEDKRALKVYGVHSGVSKILIINKEIADRITIILVKEKLGF